MYQESSVISRSPKKSEDTTIRQPSLSVKRKSDEITSTGQLNNLTDMFIDDDDDFEDFNTSSG